jgi:hypothetical protein
MPKCYLSNRCINKDIYEKDWGSITGVAKEQVDISASIVSNNIETSVAFNNHWL